MTAREILDSFSTTLIEDERILSPQERALLGTLLRHTKAAAERNQENGASAQAVIAAAIGETVAQRAFAVLGGSIVEKILEQSASVEGALERPSVEGHTQPEPPGVKRPTPSQPQTPGKPARTPSPSGPPQPEPPGRPVKTPSPPSPKPQPEPPGSMEGTKAASKASAAVTDRPALLPAKCVVLDEFLAPQELEDLMRFTLEHEADFHRSEVVSPTSEGGVIDYDHRRSRVLSDLGKHEALMVERIKAVFPEVLKKLEMEEFAISEVETQVTASNDGDFFHFHNDNGSERVSGRYLTFVYFFQRKPQGFEGGELRIHDARLEGDGYVSGGTYHKIVPRQNQIVFFPCELMHEVTAVKCSSGYFADSRFTLNGWLRR
jgi:Rps23 Pro-64 3,4-dihydroxylase Tpa1-like proline 4-hydroxylase